MTGFVYIIGAGCGKYDLITLRGLNALKQCDVIVYDALIDDTLLSFAARSAEFICVGKRAGKHSAKQDEINNILVRKALEGCCIARLKGGDPFVFGRGSEEIAELLEHQIPFEVIPGISSSVAVPELAGIPVTHRRTSREFHVITAHTADGKQDFSVYASLEGTIVFLMGLNVISDIAEGLVKGGKSPDTPAAVISNGCTERQKIVRGTLADIVQTVKNNELSFPAVIVFGDTAKYNFICDYFIKELQGISITVTGTDKFTEKISTLLSDKGAAVRKYSHVEIVRKNNIPTLEKYDCIAFTSSYGAEIFISQCIQNKTDIRTLAGKKIAVVGSGTYETLLHFGLIPDIIPEKYTVSELANKIVQNVSDDSRVLILRAELGSEDLDEILECRNISYDDIRIYDTVRNGLPAMRADSDYIVFGSSFGVRSFFEYGCTLSEKTTIICIGVLTAETAKKYSENRILTAFPHSAEGIYNTITGDIKR
ncbi:MAG: uroporphyrinogen-III C-methyltransferase [Ruminococcus sp.]|nr:uroporphyrinogen-III C-methyltransferase [Ruminococcus sp.]